MYFNAYICKLSVIFYMQVYFNWATSGLAKLYIYYLYAFCKNNIKVYIYDLFDLSWIWILSGLQGLQGAGENLGAVN